MSEAIVVDALEGALSGPQESVPLAAASSPADRAGWLEALAVALEDRVNDLVATAQRETHLSEKRLRGEVARTANQLRLFGDVVTEGPYAETLVRTPEARCHDR
jgi:NADP-dependent aldehyde dehydrogenase